MEQLHSMLGQDKDAALNAPDKRSKGEVPKDWICLTCGIPLSSYNDARVHRQRCGKRENVICPVCQKSVSKSKTTHLKMCPSLKKRSIRIDWNTTELIRIEQN